MSLCFVGCFVFCWRCSIVHIFNRKPARTHRVDLSQKPQFIPAMIVVQTLRACHNGCQANHNSTCSKGLPEWAPGQPQFCMFKGMPQWVPGPQQFCTFFWCSKPLDTSSLSIIFSGSLKCWAQSSFQTSLSNKILLFLIKTSFISCSLAMHTCLFRTIVIPGVLTGRPAKGVMRKVLFGSASCSQDST